MVFSLSGKVEHEIKKTIYIDSSMEGCLTGTMGKKGYHLYALLEEVCLTAGREGRLRGKSTK